MVGLQASLQPPSQPSPPPLALLPDTPVPPRPMRAPVSGPRPPVCATRQSWWKSELQGHRNWKTGHWPCIHRPRRSENDGKTAARIWWVLMVLNCWVIPYFRIDSVFLMNVFELCPKLRINKKRCTVYVLDPTEVQKPPSKAMKSCCYRHPERVTNPLRALESSFNRCTRITARAKKSWRTCELIAVVRQRMESHLAALKDRPSAAAGTTAWNRYEMEASAMTMRGYLRLIFLFFNKYIIYKYIIYNIYIYILQRWHKVRLLAGHHWIHRFSPHFFHRFHHLSSEAQGSPEAQEQTAAGQRAAQDLPETIYRPPLRTPLRLGLGKVRVGAPGKKRRVCDLERSTMLKS